MRKRHRSDTNARIMAAKVKRIFPTFRACLEINTASRKRGFVAQGGFLFVHDITEDTHAWTFESELKPRDRKARHTSHRA